MTAAAIAAIIFEALKLARSLGVETDTNAELTRLRFESEIEHDQLDQAIDDAIERHKET